VVRSILYILLPLAIVMSVFLVSEGVIQNFSPYRAVGQLDGAPGSTQVLPMGPVASQVSIKQLGTNGGGFMNANSSHPFENPTPLSGFIEALAILAIPAALVYTYGRMVGDTRQGWAILAAMSILFCTMLGLALWAESQANPLLVAVGVQPSGTNMEGKEVRFGAATSALWATATTAASNGSVNSMHDSFTPLGGLVPMWMMQLGEVVFGGVGSGLYGMFAFIVVAVFVAGLMVGRTPEYLGKKVESFEMKMACLAILIPVLVVLSGTALAVLTRAGISSIANPGPHGFSEVLYAFSSAGNNNGSAFAGLDASTGFYSVLLAVAMLLGRYAVAVPVLAMAGSLSGKKIVPPSAGTLPTHSVLFIVWLITVVIIVGALSFLPALALGPIIEQLRLIAR
jgi:potassium-transporting ATPase potassium-binding subunit